LKPTEVSEESLLSPGSLPGLLFIPEDGGNMLHRNVCCRYTEYMTLYPRRKSFFSTAFYLKFCYGSFSFGARREDC
jgi:hypothetical protein